MIKLFHDDEIEGKTMQMRAWIIAQEHCPECFGDLIDIEIVRDNRHSFRYECLGCGKQWNSYGDELEFAR